MKKFFILLVVIFLVSSFAGIAEEGDSGINFASMSVEELFQVIENANNELALRGQWTILPEGVYTIGIDIPIGKYEVSEHHVEERKKGDWAIDVSNNDGIVYDHIRIEFGKKVTVNFVDGDIIEVCGPFPSSAGTVLTIRNSTPIAIK